MTEYDLFQDVVKCYDAIDTHEALLDQFKEIAKESPLTGPQENALIADYKAKLDGMKADYKVLIDAFVGLYQDMQSV